MQTISIEVDQDTADAFSAATVAQRRKLELLLRLRLRELTADPVRPLSAIMDDLGQAAGAQGLTPESLESLLDGK